MKSIIIKSVLAVVSILLPAPALFADRLYIEPFEITGGVTKEVSICLVNSQSVSAFQTDIDLASGLEIVREGENWMSLGNRASADHSLIVNTDGRNNVKLVCFSNTNSAFTGNEGAVVNMKIKADEGFEGGWISLTNIKLSDSSNQDVILDNSDAYVTGVIQAQSILLNESAMELKVGQGYVLSAYVYPDNVTDRTVTWSSDNESVVTVDANGYLMAVSLGSATVTATCGNVSATCAVIVSATEVESVLLSNNEAQLKVGEVFTLTAYIYPEDATDKTVAWTSDNEAVAVVDANGNVTAVSIGTSTITASCGNYSASCVVSVVATEVESVVISQETAQLKVGENLSLTATVYPEDATDNTVEWTSDDPAVANVDANGNVTAMSLGTATVTASCGNYSASCNITVVATMVESIYLSPDNWSGTEGDSFRIEATVLPEEASDKTLIWTSSDESVATVDTEGIVTVMKAGTCVITASAADGSNVSAECIITSVAGVDGIFSADEHIDVFNLNGILIKKNIDKEEMNKLTPGIYVIRQGNDRKKVIIR